MKNLENWTDEEIISRLNVLEDEWKELREEISLLVVEIESLEAEIDRRESK